MRRSALPAYTLEWREFPQGTRDGARGSRPYEEFSKAVALRERAGALGDLAWNGEFRIVHDGREIYTDIGSVRRWDSAATPLPDGARRSLWRSEASTTKALRRLASVVVAESAIALRSGVITTHQARRLTDVALEVTSSGA